jgi:hypothetical protein
MVNMARVRHLVWLVVLGGCNLVFPFDNVAPEQGSPDTLLDGAWEQPLQDAAPMDAAPTDAPGDATPDAAPPECTTDQDCDDGIACTEDLCTAGKCSHTVLAGWCLIGSTCFADGTLNPNNVCRRCVAATAAKAWTDEPDGKLCDDAVSCTQSDACFHGYCLGLVDPGTCVVGPPGSQTCHVAGDADPNDACAVCAPDFYAHAWTPAAGCVLTLAGTGADSEQDGYLLKAMLSEPTGMALAAPGKIYVADTDGHTVRVIERSLVTTLAGCG